jgi:type II secretion system protein G
MKRFRKSEGFTLIELLIVIIIIGILAAIAIPMFLNQRAKAKDSAVKEGIHSIQVGLQSYAVDNDDTYPTTAEGGGDGALQGILDPDFVDNWPANPFVADTDMNAGAADAPGTYAYVSADGTTFELTGHLNDAADPFIVP